MIPEQLAKVKTLLIKKGYKESGMTTNWFFTEDGSDRAADLRKDNPIIGILISGNIVMSGHGNLRVEDDRTEVEAIMKSKEYTLRHPPGDKIEPPVDKEKLKEALQKSQSSVSEQAQKQPAGASYGWEEQKTKLGAGDTSSVARPLQKPQDGITAADTLVQTKDDQNKPLALSGQRPMTSGNKSVGAAGDTPAKKGTTTAICQACKCTITGTIDTFRQILDEYGVIYCQKCSEDADGKHEQKEEPPKASTPKIVKTCKSCGRELSGARALECFQKDPQKPIMICEECEDNKLVDAVLEDGLKKRHGEGRKPDGRIPVQTYTQHGNIIKGFQPSLKEIGKIKIGGKGEERPKAGGGTFRLPVKFDHFEIVSLMRDEKGDFIKDPVMQMLGESPKELDIFLLFNDPTLNFVSRYNQYHGGKCLCQGDGVTARLVDGAQVECNPDICPQFAGKKCKPNGILSVILAKSPRLGGVYKFRTTSFNSIRSILSSLFFLSNLTGGVLAMIPLKLTVTPMQVQPKDSTKPHTIFVVNIEFSGTAPELLQKTFDVQKYQSAMRENIIKLEGTARAVLTAPESKEEIKDIEAEFYPEQPKEATK